MDTGDTLTTSQKDPNDPNAPLDTNNSFHQSLSGNIYVSSVDYSVDSSRTAVVNDLPSEVPEVDFTFFQDYIFPPLNDKIQIQNVIRKLETQKVIVNGRWAAFPLHPWEYKSTTIDQSSGVLMPFWSDNNILFLAGKGYVSAIRHALSISNCEITRVLVSIFPDSFQSNVYPPALSSEPAFTAGEFFSGKTAPPKLVNLENGSLTRTLSSLVNS
ncbi:hypothetical protein BDY19DRAFT_996874 [Irpex rosettiformis]|uniref:Uncharacterized protein n=1 Tax=Irpex rosettiformis TaxID=378272 RepID=A0ACB8TTQ8_9APHY|nr:hypothetical protein BDY19DRAFT_996874 [Irpex rosettiformis]